MPWRHSCAVAGRPARLVSPSYSDPLSHSMAWTRSKLPMEDRRMNQVLHDYFPSGVGQRFCDQRFTVGVGRVTDQVETVPKAPASARSSRIAVACRRFCARRTTSPNRSAHGKVSTWSRKRRITLPVDPRSERGRRFGIPDPALPRSGSLCTMPLVSRSSPAGSNNASSPRFALFSSPAVRRPRSVCS